MQPVVAPKQTSVTQIYLLCWCILLYCCPVLSSGPGCCQCTVHLQTNYWAQAAVVTQARAEFGQAAVVTQSTTEPGQAVGLGQARVQSLVPIVGLHWMAAVMVQQATPLLHRLLSTMHWLLTFSCTGYCRPCTYYAPAIDCLSFGCRLAIDCY